MKDKEEKLKEIIQLVKENKISAYEISKNTGISEAGIGKILNKISANPRKLTIDTIHNYLFSNKIEKNNEAEQVEIFNNKGKGVPYYDVDFTASFLQVENSQQLQPDSYINHPFFKGCDYVVRASGQSMAKIIAHGDAIGLKRIHNWQEFFPFGEIYAIVTKDDFRMIKVITKGETEDSYTLISKPTDGKKQDFPPQQIKKTSILYIYKVQASSHLF